MLKRKISNLQCFTFLLFSVFTCLISADKVFAESNSSQETQVGISITAPTIWIETVSHPSFGKAVQKPGEYKLQAETPLKITIRDQRDNKTGWKLIGQWSEVENIKTKESFGVDLEINKKVLVGYESFVQNQSIHIKENGENSKEEHNLDLSKEEVTLRLPNNITPGEYHGTITWVLQDTP